MVMEKAEIDYVILMSVSFIIDFFPRFLCLSTEWPNVVSKFPEKRKHHKEPCLLLPAIGVAVNSFDHFGPTVHRLVVIERKWKKLNHF